MHANCCRTFGPFLANYYINPHAPAIRIQEEPRVRLGELAANGCEYYNDVTLAKCHLIRFLNLIFEYLNVMVILVSEIENFVIQ